MRNSGNQAYHATQVSTADSLKLVILMYDGSIRFIKEAMESLQTGDVARRGMQISRAQRIVNELESALDKGRGGEVAIELEKVYMEINKLLNHANINGDETSLKTALDMMTTIREGWDQIVTNQRSQAPVVKQAQIAFSA